MSKAGSTFKPKNVIAAKPVAAKKLAPDYNVKYKLHPTYATDYQPTFTKYGNKWTL